MTDREHGLLARSGHMEYDRILFFSDAIFAIAITLLVVDLPSRLVEITAAGHGNSINSGRELDHAIDGIFGFAISFVVIALYWVGHHGMFRYIKTIDRPLMLLNLLFLGIIAFLPYPTALLSPSVHQTPAVVFYACCAGLAGLLETVMWLHAIRSPLGLTEDAPPQVRRVFLLRCVRVPVVFAVSIVIALFDPLAATYCWILIAVSGGLIDRFFGLPTDPDVVATADTSET